MARNCPGLSKGPQRHLVGKQVGPLCSSPRASSSLSHIAAGGPQEIAPLLGTGVYVGTATTITTLASGEGTLFCPLLFRLENRHTLLELLAWIHSM